MVATCQLPSTHIMGHAESHDATRGVEHVLSPAIVAAAQVPAVVVPFNTPLAVPTGPQSWAPFTTAEQHRLARTLGTDRFFAMFDRRALRSHLKVLGARPAVITATLREREKYRYASNKARSRRAAMRIDEPAEPHQRRERRRRRRG